jgi:hypothetical protein
VNELRISPRVVVRVGDHIRVSTRSVTPDGHRVGPSGRARVCGIGQDGTYLWAAFERNESTWQLVYVGPERRLPDRGVLLRPARVRVCRRRREART